MSKEWAMLHGMLSTSGCDKHAVAAGTYVKGEFIMKTNYCEYTGIVCPRLMMETGEGYELCKSHHAEAALFDYLDQWKVKSDGIVWVYGHYYVCEPCAKLLKNKGVKEFRVKIM